MWVSPDGYLCSLLPFPLKVGSVTSRAASKFCCSHPSPDGGAGRSQPFACPRQAFSPFGWRYHHHEQEIGSYLILKILIFPHFPLFLSFFVCVHVCVRVCVWRASARRRAHTRLASEYFKLPGIKEYLPSMTGLKETVEPETELINACLLIFFIVLKVT